MSKLHFYRDFLAGRCHEFLGNNLRIVTEGAIARLARKETLNSAGKRVEVGLVGDVASLANLVLKGAVGDFLHAQKRHLTS